MDFAEMGDGSDGSGDWGLILLSCPSHVVFIGAIVAKMLNGLSGRFKSFKLGGTIGSCRPNLYGIVGSMERSLRVTICGSGDATEETVGISVVSVSDSSVEFRIFGQLFRCELRLFVFSRKNTSETTESAEILEAMLNFTSEIE